MNTLVAFLACVAVASASYGGHSTQHQSRSDYGDFNYGYADPNSRKEEVGTHGGDVVKGTYSYVAPDGQVIVNDYYADENGFRSNLAPTAPYDVHPEPDYSHAAPHAVAHAGYGHGIAHAGYGHGYGYGVGHAGYGLGYAGYGHGLGHYGYGHGLGHYGYGHGLGYAGYGHGIAHATHGYAHGGYGYGPHRGFSYGFTAAAPYGYAH